jgi:gliding motility-associated-like protein
MFFSKNRIFTLLCLLLCVEAFAQQQTRQSFAGGKKNVAGGWIAGSETLPGNIKAFEENKGQYKNPLNAWNVSYACNNKGTTIYFTNKGIVYSLPDNNKKEETREEEGEENEKGTDPVFHLLGMEWTGANPAARIEAVDEAPFFFTSSNIQDPSIAVNNIRGFRKLIYHDLYPGIDVTFTFHPETGIKYTLTVKPGTDASVFHMRYSGQNGLKIDRKGNLLVSTPAGTLLDHAPVSNLLSGAKVASSFKQISKDEVGFSVDKRFSGQGLVIDPWTVTPLTIVPATFVPTFVGMDAGNNVYITGIDAGTKLCYTQKYTAAGALSWTYTFNEYGNSSWVAGMAVDPAGNSYVGQPKGSHTNTAGMYYEMVCLATGGTRTYFNQTYAIQDIYETLTLAYSCNAQTVVEAGARYKGQPGNITYASVMNPLNGNVGNVSFDSLTGEVYGGCIAPNGNYYCLAVDSNKSQGTTNPVANSTGPYNNLRCYTIAGTTITPAWKYPVGYGLVDYTAKSGPKSLSLNGVGASCAFLYTTDGVSLDQRSLATGIPSKRVTIPGGSNAVKGNVNGGLTVDLKCGYVYVGSVNNVYVYDANLNPVFTYAGLPGIVYDVKYNNGFIAVTGATAGDVAFVAQFPAQNCSNPLAHVNPTCGQNNGTATAAPTFCAAPYTYLWTPSGQTTATATGLGAGTYTVQIGSGSGCVTVTDTVTLKSASGGTEAIAGTNVKCAGGTNGTATVTMTGGTTPFTYTWSPVPTTGQGTATASGLGAGTYSCSVSDNGGCTTTQTVIITAPTALTAPNTPTNVTCNGGSNGSATLTASGGTGAYTYSWTPAPASGTAATASNLTAGSYTCTVTDANGCTITSPVTITQPVAVTATSTSNPALCGTTNGSATATGANGVGAYTYSWNPSGQTTQTATALGAGTYTCSLTDANGCTATTTVTVGNTGGPTVTLGAPTNITCFGLCNGAAPVTATGGIGPYTYSWTPAPGAGQATANATALCAGTYTCNVTDSQGCVSSVTVVITQPVALAASSSATNVVCFGQANGTATGTATGGTTNYTYSWNPAPGAGQGTLSASLMTAGTYTLNVTDANGCTVTSTATITQPPLLTLNAAGVNATCAGKCNGQLICIPAGGTTNFSFSWNTGCVQASCMNACAGTYTATVTDAHGCTATDTALVKQPTPLAVNMTPKPAHCNKPDGHDSVFVSGGTAGYTYSWSPGASNSFVAPNLLPGSYTVYIQDNNGCRDSMTNTVANLPGVVVAPKATTRDSCNGGNNGTATVTATGGNPAYTYSWTPAAAIGGGQGATTATGLIAGTYTCTVTDSANCISVTTLAIGQPPPVTLALNAPGPICIGACTTIIPTGSGGSPGYTYTYNQAGTVLASGTVCPVVTSTYTVNCADSHGCATAPAQVTVTVYPPVEVVAAGGKQICPGASALLNATSSLGNGGPYTYSWTPSAGLDNPTLANPKATPTASPTTYTAIVTDGCTLDSAIVTITLFPAPVVSFTSKDTVKCAPVCVNFTGTSTPTCLTGSWNFGDNSPLSNTCNTATHCYNQAGNYTVTYSIVDADGCPGTASVVNFINALPVPEANFSASPQPATILNPQIFFTDQSTSSAVDTVNAWAWSFGDFTGATSSIRNPNYTYPDTGCFPVQLIVTGLNGCKDTVVHPVCIQPYFTFYAPNTFTPNGDGLNDTWSPNGIGIDPNNYHLMMFDRWGNLMWETHTWLEGWDGKANGGAKIAQIDTYVWKVDLNDVFQNKHHYIGHCNIIK